MAKTKPLFWLTGNFYDVAKQWKQILDFVKDANVQVLDCGYNSENVPSGCRMATAADVIMALKNKDIFDQRVRIIKLRGIPEDYALIADYLHLVNDRNILVVVGPVGYRSHMVGHRFITAASSKFYKSFVSGGRVFEFPDAAATPSDAIKWVTTLVSDHDRKIDDTAVKLLVEMKGLSLDLLYTEISKLLDYSGKTIKEEDVKTCCIPLFQKTTWDLIDSLDTQNYEKCISHLQSFYEIAGSETGTSFRGDVEMLLGAMHQHFLFLLLLKNKDGVQLSYNIAKANLADIKKRTKTDNGTYVWDKDLYDGGFISRNLGKSSVQSAYQWKKQHVYKTFQALCQCRKICRMSSLEGEIKLALDSFVMAVCGIVPSDKIESMYNCITRSGIQ